MPQINSVIMEWSMENTALFSSEDDQLYKSGRPHALSGCPQYKGNFQYSRQLFEWINCHFMVRNLGNSRQNSRK